MIKNSPGLLGRQKALQKVFSSFTTHRSMAMIGEPNVGKTRLIDAITQPEIKKYWYPDPDKLAIVKIDGKELTSSMEPAGFWELVFKKLAASDTQLIREKAIRFASKKDYGTFSLRSFFLKIQREGQQVALIIDHIEHFLQHPSLVSNTLLGAIRSISSTSEGLSILIAGRKTLHEFNLQTSQITHHGSPFFNTLSEWRLNVFELEEARGIVANCFDTQNIDAVLRVTGRHPYLISRAIALSKKPFDAAKLIEVLTPIANEHYTLAIRYLGDFSDAFLAVLNMGRPDFKPRPFEIDELIRRGWVKRSAQGELFAESILLRNWLTARITDDLVMNV